MTSAVLSTESRVELAAAVAFIAEDNRQAASALQRSAVEAARHIGEHPMIGQTRPDIAPARFRFWLLRRFDYVLVYRCDTRPPRILRIVHTSRDLHTLLAGLDAEPG